MTAVRLVTTTVLAVFMTGQTIVESEAPRDPDLTLADEPLFGSVRSMVRWNTSSAT